MLKLIKRARVVRTLVSLIPERFKYILLQTTPKGDKTLVKRDWYRKYSRFIFNYDNRFTFKAIEEFNNSKGPIYLWVDEFYFMKKQGKNDKYRNTVLIKLK